MYVFTTSGDETIQQIFTSNPLDTGDLPQVVPKKKPYIIFKLPFTDMHSKYLKKIGLEGLGIGNYDNNEITFTITSDRKVILAIDLFFKERNIYPQKLNPKLYEQLNQLKAECKQRLQQKPKKSLPQQSRKSSDYVEIGGAITQSANITTQVQKIKNPTKKYIRKLNSTKRKISEIEAYNGYAKRLLLGDRHPKIRVTHNEQGELDGLLSERFSSFQSFRDKYIKYFKEIPPYQEQYRPTKEELLKSETVKVWVTAYTEEEDDLHIGNYGSGPNAYSVNWDDDRATWALTAKYAGYDPTKPRTHLATPAPVDTFPITSRDILHFPYLRDAKPYHWPGKHDAGLMDNAFQLVTEKKFIEDKFYMFLKRILIPREAYEAIGLATISSNKKRKEVVDHKCNRTEELKKVLIEMPEFQEYVISHPEAIAKIQEEFGEYNKDYKKEKDAYLRVSTTQVAKNFEQIKQAIEGAKKTRETQDETNRNKIAQLLTDTKPEDWGTIPIDDRKLISSIKNGIQLLQFIAKLPHSFQIKFLELMKPEDLSLHIENSSGFNTQELPALNKQLSELSLKAKIELLKLHGDKTVEDKNIIAQLLVDLIKQDFKKLSETPDIRKLARYENFEDITHLPFKARLKLFKEMGPTLALNSLAEINKNELKTFIFLLATNEELAFLINGSMETLNNLLILLKPQDKIKFIAHLGTELNALIRTPSDLLFLLSHITESESAAYVGLLIANLNKTKIQAFLKNEELNSRLKEIYFLLYNNTHVGDQFINFFGVSTILSAIHSYDDLHEFIHQLPEALLTSSLPTIFNQYPNKQDFVRLLIRDPIFADALGNTEEMRSAILNQFETDLSARKLIHEIFSVHTLKKALNEYKSQFIPADEERVKITTLINILSKTVTNPLTDYPAMLLAFKKAWEDKTLRGMLTSNKEAKNLISLVDSIAQHSILSQSMFRKPPEVKPKNIHEKPAPSSSRLKS